MPIIVCTRSLLGRIDSLDPQTYSIPCPAQQARLIHRLQRDQGHSNQGLLTATDLQSGKLLALKKRRDQRIRSHHLRFKFARRSRWNRNHNRLRLAEPEEQATLPGRAKALWRRVQKWIG